MASTQNRKQNVVVIGGGISGVTVVRELSKRLDRDRFNLILIEPRSHCVWLPAVARLVVTSDEEFTETALLPFDELFVKDDKVVLKQDKVVSINEEGEEGGELELVSGETLRYRGKSLYTRRPYVHPDTKSIAPVLVLATGSKWSGPIDLPDSEADLHQVLARWHEKFKAAEDIVIVGGGAVGVELSGEIRDEYPVRLL